MKFKYFFTLFFLISLSTLVNAQGTQIDPSLAKGAPFGPGDEIAGRVVGETQYDFVATVNEDGFIEVPFADKPVLALCRTERELRTDITNLLKKELRNPQFGLRVTIRMSRPPTTISGEVNAPQQVVLMRKVTLIELLSIAGGAKEEAGGVIQVFRPQPPMCSDPNDEGRWKVDSSDPTQIPSRIYSLAMVRSGREDSNPIIYPGDVVVVQRAAPVYITGEVVAPQGIYLKEGGLSLTEAIAKIGGVRREAKTKDIKIYRLKPDSVEREVITANYDLIRKGTEKDVMLQPSDIVEVDKAKESVASQILRFAIGAAKATAMAGATNVGYRVIY